MAGDHDEIIRKSYNNNETDETNDNLLKSVRKGNKDSSPVSSNELKLSDPNSVNGDGGRSTDVSDTNSFSSSSSLIGDYKNIRATIGSEIPPIIEQPARREENPFSFKHFLSRDPTINSVPSSTITSINSNSGNTFPSATIGCNWIDSSNINSTNNNNCNNSLEINFANGSGSGCGSGSVISSVTSTVNTTIGSSTSMSSVSSYQKSTGARPKVPQSSSVSTTSMSSLIGGGNESSSSSRMKRSPKFSSFDSQASLAKYTTIEGAASTTAGGPNFDHDPSSNFRDNHDPSIDDIVSSTISSDTSDRSFVPRSYSHYDLDVPGFDDRIPSRRKTSPLRPNRLAGVFPQVAPSSYQNASGSGNIRPPNPELAAAALPDFVRDHWMDPWYFNEVNLTSPPNSPNSTNSSLYLGEQQLPTGLGNQQNQDKCQTLPDFLSDGPIIHSSGRLADVATGLPALDSPEEDSPNILSSRLMFENKRLRRELDEARLSLAEQTRRADDLEQTLQQKRDTESAYNRKLAKNMVIVEDNLDKNKKRTVAAENQVSKLKMQIKRLTSDIESLRAENEQLREDGAAGGNRRMYLRRSARAQNHQISRELLNAAENAEGNLKQLLAGVQNLRLMAANIESATNSDYFNSANYTSPEEYLSDFDDFEDYHGPGPAL